MALRTRLPFLATGALLAATASGAARAEEPPAAPAPEPALAAEPAPPPERVWYGAPMLAIDAASLGLVAAGVMSNLQPYRNANTSAGNAMIVAGYGAFLLPPVLHFAHGNRAAGVTSLIARAFMPATVVLTSAALGAQPSGGGSLGSGPTIPAAAASIGLLVVALVDDLGGAYEAPPPPPSASLRLVPQVAVGPVTSVGLGGVF